MIYDEINTYKDSPADLIYDTFEDLLFADSELGHNILGSKQSLKRQNGDSIRRFVDRTYTTDQMVFSHDRQPVAEGDRGPRRQILRRDARHRAGFDRQAPAPCEPFDRTVLKHTHQTHCIIGNRACGSTKSAACP